MQFVDRGLWGYEVEGEKEKEAALDLESKYEQLDRLQARTPYNLDYQIETEGWIEEIKQKYGVEIRIR